MEKVIKYKCDYCGKLFDTEETCEWHEDKHVKADEANRLLMQGYTLDEINNKCKIWYSIPEHLKNVTKDNCFAISYLQGCKKPAYRINRIGIDGRVNVNGCGSWAGYYNQEIALGDEDLKNPRPKEELYVDKRYKQWMREKFRE